MKRKLTTADLEAQAELERQKNGQEGQLEASQPKNGRRVKKLKKKRTWKFYAGIVSVVLAIAVAVGAALYKIGILDPLKKEFSNDDTDKDEITAIADMLPIDNNGIIEITYPIVDRTLEETNGRFSLPQGFVPYYISEREIATSLSETNNTTAKNVTDYEANSENKPTGYIGLDQDYAGFMTRIEDIKVKIAAGDTTYTAPLKTVDYEVSDLYSIPDGYDLYTEDSEARGYAKLAYIDTNGSKVYMIPSMFINKFVGVKTEIVELITKYEGLKEQVIFVYNTYNNNAREVIEAIDEETTNRGR